MSRQGYKKMLKKKKKSNQNGFVRKKDKKRQLDIFDYNIISKKHKQ